MIVIKDSVEAAIALSGERMDLSDWFNPLYCNLIAVGVYILDWKDSGFWYEFRQFEREVLSGVDHSRWRNGDSPRLCQNRFWTVVSMITPGFPRGDRTAEFRSRSWYVRGSWTFGVGLGLKRPQIATELPRQGCWSGSGKGGRCRWGDSFLECDRDTGGSPLFPRFQLQQNTIKGNPWVHKLSSVHPKGRTLLQT